MKPLFTIHEGEFLVGDHITTKLGGKYDVWVPAKDSGVDLLVTDKGRRGKSVGLQVKFSLDFDSGGDLAPHVEAASWFTLDPTKIRSSCADLWVFVILTLRHERHFVVIPTRELRKRIPPGKRWTLYLWVYANRTCYDVRGLRKGEKLDAVHRGVRDRSRDFSEWLERWDLLQTNTQGIA